MLKKNFCPCRELNTGRSTNNQGTLQSVLFSCILHKICFYLFIHVCACTHAYTCFRTCRHIKCLHMYIGISAYKGRMASSGIMLIPDFMKHCSLAGTNPNDCNLSCERRDQQYCVSVDKTWMPDAAINALLLILEIPRLASVPKTGLKILVIFLR